MFKKAVKRDAKLRFAISGPAGAGKTFTLLKLAKALLDGTNKRIAVVDTEHGSASKYAHTDTCGGEGVCTHDDHFEFDVIEPDTYDPRDLVKYIEYAEGKSSGYGAIITDSLSHFWMGTGGELDLVDKTAAKNNRGSGQGNSFAAWKTVTPYHNALVDKMIASGIHVLVSMRTKIEWVIEKDKDGKSVPRKIGTAPVMRDGIEYEFDVAGEIDQDNTLVITKSRCSKLAGAVINRPGGDMAQTLLEWLAGAPAAPTHAPASSDVPKQPAAAQPAQDEAEPLSELDELLAKCTKQDGIREALDVVLGRLDALIGEKGNLVEVTKLVCQQAGYEELSDAYRRIGNAKKIVCALYEYAAVMARTRSEQAKHDDVPVADEPQELV